MYEKYAKVENGLVIEIMDNEELPDTFKVSEMVKVGWSYNAMHMCCYPPKAPEGYYYDHELDMFMPMSKEAKEREAELEEAQEIKRKNISAHCIDEYTLQLMEGGLL